MFTDLSLMGSIFSEGPIFHHGKGMPDKLPIFQCNGAFPLLEKGRFPTLMGRFPERLNGLFSLLKGSLLENSPLRKGALRGHSLEMPLIIRETVLGVSAVVVAEKQIVNKSQEKPDWEHTREVSARSIRSRQSRSVCICDCS